MRDLNREDFNRLISVEKESGKRLTIAEIVDELGIARAHAETYKSLLLNQNFVSGKPEREGTLVIGDLHEPFTREGYLEFCLEMYDEYNLKDVVFTGDILDNHFSSYHETNADGHSAAEELKRAKDNIIRWYNAFPVADVCIGNHDSLPNRKAMTSGVSKHWVRSIGEVLDTPNWNFRESFTKDGILYCHGIGRKARQRAVQDGISVIQGHYHSEGYVHWFVGQHHKWFAMQIGCGVDDKSYAMEYGKHFSKMHINVGIVKDGGQPAFLKYMNL